MWLDRGGKKKERDKHLGGSVCSQLLIHHILFQRVLSCSIQTWLPTDVALWVSAEFISLTTNITQQIFMEFYCVLVVTKPRAAEIKISPQEPHRYLTQQDKGPLRSRKPHPSFSAQLHTHLLCAFCEMKYRL